ncbi:hypothetical protein J1614_003145 [Plenodomus biglobosus]|nr:hypothetical protein J1614_003145 [Plenodomus biglobosus]
MGEVTTQSAEVANVASAAGVNAKQHNRIIKRRLARQKLEAAIAISRNSHKSVASHPLQHPTRFSGPSLRRGPDGHPLTSEHLATKELEKLSIQAGN